MRRPGSTQPGAPWSLDEYQLDDPAQAGWRLLVHADEADAMKESLLAPGMVAGGSTGASLFTS